MFVSLVFVTSQQHNNGHFGDVQLFIGRGRPQTYVRLAGKPPHMKFLALTRTQTHTVRGWRVSSQRSNRSAKGSSIIYCIPISVFMPVIHSQVRFMLGLWNCNSENSWKEMWQSCSPFGQHILLNKLWASHFYFK